MALKATVYKAEIDVSDVDRGYYASHELTLARHPSETEERLMLRLMAFAVNAEASLDFGRGISTDDEPDVWARDPSGLITHWIELGSPDDRRLRRAAGKARRVTLYGYGQRGFDVWWRKHAGSLARLASLAVWFVPDDAVTDLASLARRNLRLQWLIQDGQVTVSDTERVVVVEPVLVQAAAGS